jgi:hypothetical protein
MTWGGPNPQCFTQPADKPVTSRYYDLRNNGTSPVTVLSVSLPPGARRLTRTKARLVPIDSSQIGPGWPLAADYPAHLAAPAVGHRRRHPARPDAGARIRTDANVRPRRPVGWHRHYYSSGPAHYVLDGPVALMVSQNCYAEPSPWNSVRGAAESRPCAHRQDRQPGSRASGAVLPDDPGSGWLRGLPGSMTARGDNRQRPQRQRCAEKPFCQPC